MITPVDDVPRAFSDVVVGAFVARPGPRFTLVLSGGPTARACYELLSGSGGIDWTVVDVYVGDERVVPPDDEDSNARLIREALLDRVGPVGSFSPMPTEGPVAECVAAYQRTMTDVVTGAGIDLIHLGMGPDGHTASLFPAAPTLDADPGTLVLATEDRAGTTRTRASPSRSRPSIRPGWRSSRSPGRPRRTRSLRCSTARTCRRPGCTRGTRCGWWTVRPAPPPPRLAPMLSDADILDTPLADLTALARVVARRRTRPARHLLAQGLHSAHHAVPRPLRLLHLRQGAGPPHLPVPHPRRGARRGPGGARRGLPRGALHPGRAARAALSGGARLAGRARPRVHGGLPRRDVPPRPGGDRPPPPRQRRRAVPRRAGPLARGLGEPGDDDRVTGPGPGRAPWRARQGPGAPAGHARGGRRARHPVHHGDPGRDRRRPARAAGGAAGDRRLARPPRPRAGGHRPELPPQARDGDGAGRALPSRGPAVGHRGGTPRAPAPRSTSRPLRTSPTSWARCSTPASTTGAASRRSRPTT